MAREKTVQDVVNRLNEEAGKIYNLARLSRIYNHTEFHEHARKVIETVLPCAADRFHPKPRDLFTFYVWELSYIKGANKDKIITYDRTFQPYKREGWVRQGRFSNLVFKALPGLADKTINELPAFFAAQHKAEQIAGLKRCIAQLETELAKDRAALAELEK